MGVLSSAAVCWKVASAVVQRLGVGGGVPCVVLLMGGLALGGVGGAGLLI